MSSSQKLQSEYLTCSQCAKPFHHPKTLPCMHNFCKACLSAYLENVMKGGRHTTFKCPDCRTKIFVPDPGKPVARWASQFPTNFVLSGMIEAIADEADGDDEGGMKVKAAKERRGDADEEFAIGDSTDAKTKDKTPPRGIEGQLAELETTLKKEDSVLCAQINALDGEQALEKQKLENSFQKVQELIESQKMSLLEEMEENFLEEKDRIKQTQQSLQNDIKSVGSCHELLSSLKSLSEDVATDMLDAINAQVREIQARPTKVIARRVKFDQKLEAGRSILNLIDDLGSITITTAGEVSRSEGAGGATREVDNEETGIDATKVKILATPKFLTAISTRYDNKKMQQIYDITVMPSGVVVMTAYGSNVVMAAKSDGNTYKIFSSLTLDSEPKSITTISPYYVGVVGKLCVYIIGVTQSDTLVMKKRVSTGKEYVGIAAYSEASLILCSQSPPTVDFVGLNGFISETIDRDHTTNIVLFRNPQFITTSHEGVIYVTDASRSPCVLSVNNAGKLRFKYPASASELQAPQGVACDSRGHVYVVDRGLKTVVLLTPTGEKVRDLLTSEEGLTDPCAIAIDKNDRLYVTNDFSEVLIFQIR